jgi:threonine dehydrogenase-like Zn-dependent dehydrogenase
VQVEAAERLEVGRAPEGEYDLVVEAAGSASAVASAVQLLRPGATLLLLASYWEPIEFPAFFNAKELVLVGSQTHGHHGGSRVIDEAAALVGRVPELSAALITHRFPLDQAAQAFATAADRAAGAIKVVLEP